MLELRFSRLLELGLWAVLLIGGSAKDATQTVTTAPIFLPYYHEEAWSAVRGSVIGIDETAHHTTYTIFCPDNDPLACDLSLEFPFEFVEGPDTVEFHGTYTSTYIADLECTLNGTTAATCSGYSSFKAGYNFHTGPTEVSWTSTFSGSDVEWGVLTMAEKPTTTDDSWDITATAAWTTPVTGSSGYASIPQATGEEEAAGVVLRVDWGLVICAMMGFILVAF